VNPDYPTLDSVKAPEDLRSLDAAALDLLAAEIRDFLVTSVSRTGGHLGPNLGVVELSIALHRVFDSPRDHLVFDTGHQSYVHKILTGRRDFSALRSAGGLSGYPSRLESEHDIVENSHASTSLSWAHGLARASHLAGRQNCTVAVIGDGALTGGMAWEALNNIASDRSLRLVLVVNDNGRSYAPTIGGLGRRLAQIRASMGYEHVLSTGKATLKGMPVLGGPAYRIAHGVKAGLKDALAPQRGMFEDLGIKYIGPVDGHDREAVEQSLRAARAFGEPCIVHVITRKGNGYRPAETDHGDHWHGVGRYNPETGLPFEVAGRTWTDAFGDAMVELGHRDPAIVAVTAAMLVPVGLDRFAEAFPDRIVDVGIAEQHATTMAAGLSHGGMHPVVAIYSTFLNRAFDQLLMDCALHRQAVTFVLDRAGITGPDGASHHGVWDLAICSTVPGVRVAAPRDAPALSELLGEAVATTSGPTVLRFPKATVGAPIARLRREGTLDVLYEDADPEVVLVGVGPMCEPVLRAAGLVAESGRRCVVIDPRWVLPVHDDLVALARRVGRAVVVEDALVTHGVGASLSNALRSGDGIGARVLPLGVPAAFHPHGSRAAMLDELGLSAEGIARHALGLLDLPVPGALPDCEPAI
jgi:1-deoxy-D-xylulose-5-phosphate synthase